MWVQIHFKSNFDRRGKKDYEKTLFLESFNNMIKNIVYENKPKRKFFLHQMYMSFLSMEFDEKPTINVFPLAKFVYDYEIKYDTDDDTNGDVFLNTMNEFCDQLLFGKSGHLGKTIHCILNMRGHDVHTEWKFYRAQHLWAKYLRNNIIACGLANELLPKLK